MGGADRMAQITHFVGLDVHAKQTHAGVFDHGTGELRRRRLRGDPSRARQRLSHFLRRRALGFSGAGKSWTQAHRKWLRGLVFDDRASEVTFADYLAAVDAIEQRRDTVEATLEELAPASPWA